jgi:hypothetical protein
MSDYPTPETYPLPEAVEKVTAGTLPIPERDGFKAQHRFQETCAWCRLYLQHEHGGIAAWPY